jgi:hypothetical protein
MTKEKAQRALDAISEVCKTHDVMLFGVCMSENVGGEIELVDAEARNLYRVNHFEEFYSELSPAFGKYFIVDGIG